MERSPAVKKEDQDNWHISTWVHRACFAAGCATVIFAAAKSISLTSSLVAETSSSRLWLKTLSAALLGYVAADLATGIYHWAIDNYGSAKTPFFGAQIEAFQSHHQQPWAITRRQLANNLYIAAAAVTAVFLPVNIFMADPFNLAFAATLAGCIMFSQQFHAWAHMPKGKIPAVVAALQNAGVLVGRGPHATHHHAPYNNNYCIVSGVWNRFLDETKFWLAAEMVLEKISGARPRSWGKHCRSGRKLPRNLRWSNYNYAPGGLPE